VKRRNETHVALLLPLLLLAAGPSLRAAEKSDWGNFETGGAGPNDQGHSHRREIVSGRFSISQRDALVVRLAGGTEAPRETVQRVSIKRDGHQASMR